MGSGQAINVKDDHMEDEGEENDYDKLRIKMYGWGFVREKKRSLRFKFTMIG